MRIDIYGVFLITGECVTVEGRLRRWAATRVARALRRTLAEPARVSVTLAEMLLRDGEVLTRCEIRARSDDGGRLAVVALAPTTRGALEKSTDRLTKTPVGRDISAVARA